MQRRTLKVALLAVLATFLVLGSSGLALADQTWQDLPDSVTAKYGITDNQVAGISEGYPGGLWRPFSNVSRAQFTKMAVAAFDLSMANSALASYTDVPKSNHYYPYVEGAKAAGIVTGTTATTFSPNLKITRQQALAIVARYIAKAQGYDLATMYTSDELSSLLSHFGDRASISPDLKEEVAFAFDMGITAGDDYGNVKPLANLTRIQAAALLVRAQGLVPPNMWVPANLQLVSADKTEGLIGQTFSVSFLVTTAEGHPAKDVLVDLDALTGAEFYVGNLSRQAGVTDSNGLVTVDLVSTEPGTQRVAASVAGVGTKYTTRYWVALDEVYNIEGATAQNNAGVEHLWGARVVVFGPGPRSTSQNDWYNAIDADFDPEDIDTTDGIDAICDGYVADDGWTLEYETYLASLGFKPRTMAGIDVEWSIYDFAGTAAKSYADKVTSVGDIVKVDGASIAPVKSVTGKTDVNGYSTITVVSEAIGTTLTRAIAGYKDNPYPKQLFNHLTFQDTQQHWHDWNDQPDANALQTKTWIPHVIGDGEPGPISPSYLAANIGEEKTLTITVTDQFGNPIVGKSVEWTMQGVGFFQTDDKGDTSNPEVAAKNKDFDTTNAAGQASLFVKSFKPGEQIIHAKIRDKGTSGAEGTYLSYTSEVQWFDADVVTFDDITTTGKDVSGKWQYENEALSTNPLSANTHEFCARVYGLKLEYDPTPDEPSRQTRYIDSDASKSAYDGIFDAKDAAYFGGILLVNPLDLYRPDSYTGGSVTAITLTGYGTGYTAPPTLTIEAPSRPDGVQAKAHAVVLVGGITEVVIDNPGKGYDKDNPPLITFTGGDGDGPGVGTDPVQASAVATVSPIVTLHNVYADGVEVSPGGKVLANSSKMEKFYSTVAGHRVYLSYVGGYTKYDYDDDGYLEDFTGQTGIYLPLVGKLVYFTRSNYDDPLVDLDGHGFSNLGEYFDGEVVGAVGDAFGTMQPEGYPQTPNTIKVLTDETGKACLTITNQSTNRPKGPETVKAVVDWPGNPHNRAARVAGYAKKLWTAGSATAPADVRVIITIGQGEKKTIVYDNTQYIHGELAESSTAPWTIDANTGDLILNSAHVEVHVLDRYGNDLPDYEVVYLLEDIGSRLGSGQEAEQTYIPFAYLTDADSKNNLLDLAGTVYDQNDSRPDNNEPAPESDPYARIVGKGGTQAFFFNQDLGSEKPTAAGQAGLDMWWTRVSDMGFLGYVAPSAQVWPSYQGTLGNPDFDTPAEAFNGFDGRLEAAGATAPAMIGLATDGAKAWTSDGYWLYDATKDGVENPEVHPNLLTGSSVDIQLADDTRGAFARGTHVKSILRVMIYAPADGLVQEGEPIWSYQVHHIWEEPIPTSITLTLTPGTTTTLPQVVAKVVDQFDNPMEGVDVYFNSIALEGAALATGLLNEEAVTTDDKGNALVTVGAGHSPGVWAVEEVSAKVYLDAAHTKARSAQDEITIEWISRDVLVTGMDLLSAVAGESRVTVNPGYSLWNGLDLAVHPGSWSAPAAGTGKYVSSSPLSIAMTTGTPWSSGNVYFVHATNSSNSDEIPNWVWDSVP